MAYRLKPNSDYQPLDIERLPIMFEDWRYRQIARDARHAIIDAVVGGELREVDPDEETLKNRSPNLIQVGIEDTAESAAIVPTIRVDPNGEGEAAMARAERMERVAVQYLDVAEIELQIPRLVMDAAAYGLMVGVVVKDKEQRLPIIERRDPRTFYPNMGYRPGDPVKDCFFARSVYLSQLPLDYQEKLLEIHPRDEGVFMGPQDDNIEVVLIDYYDEREHVLAAMVGASRTGIGGDVQYTPIELDRTEHGSGYCPVVVEARITIDGEFRGQFDQVVQPWLDHMRLRGLMLDYADQAVYSDIWVKDLIGDMSYGGGGFIELGPQGQIGRVPPAVSSMNLQADLDGLMDAIHLGGRYPKSRPGEIDQSIASAKFLEASAGMMNTAIRTYHILLKRFYQKAIRISFDIAKRCFPGKRQASGVLRNHTFMIEYNASDFDIECRIRVEYGLGLGRDPGQSAILHINYAKEGFISKQYVREHIDGLTDVELEDIRTDVEEWRAMAQAKIMESVQTGLVPLDALPKMARARMGGMDIFTVLEKFVIQPMEEAQAAMVPTGLGAPMAPGAGPGAPPGPPGLAPAPGGAAPAPPTPPDPGEIMARISAETAGGGLIGAQVT